jgi:hypothetical protein
MVPTTSLTPARHSISALDTALSEGIAPISASEALSA